MHENIMFTYAVTTFANKSACCKGTKATCPEQTAIYKVGPDKNDTQFYPLVYTVEHSALFMHALNLC